MTADRILTGNGSLQLIEFLCLHLLEAGDVVFTEAPTYDRTLTLLRRHRAKVVGIPLEADGPDIDALERALARQVPKFFYVIPDFQNPAGATCSGAKRRQIVELAAGTDSCSSKTRRTACFGIAARRNRRSMSSRRTARFI